MLSQGEKGEVVEILGPPHDRHKRYEHHRPHPPRQRRHHRAFLEKTGIRPGKIIEMISNYGVGPIIIKIDEAKIAIGRGMATKILVKLI